MSLEKREEVNIQFDFEKIALSSHYKRCNIRLFGFKDEVEQVDFVSLPSLPGVSCETLRQVVLANFTKF